MNDKRFYTIMETPHYKYRLNIDEKVVNNKYPNAHLYVGDPLKPCLSMSVPLIESLDVYRDFDMDNISIAYLNRLENISNCILNDVDMDIRETNSFTKEMFINIMEFLRRRFPQIYHIKFVDTSVIPCGDDDTLDLMYYYIAIHQESWYESMFQAYFLPKKKFTSYRCSVDKYGTEETKKNISWPNFYKMYFSSTNDFAKSIIHDNIEKIKDFYETSLTIPDFLKKFSKLVPRRDKCKFFKGWIISFLERFEISPLKTWFINLHNVHRKHFTGGQRIYTRKQKRSNH